MKHVKTAERLFLGLIFFIFGLNGFFQFIPMPAPPMNALPFLQGLGSTGYFFPLLAATQTLTGLALLTNRFVPLALIVLAPVILHINLYHLYLVPEFGMAIFISALELHLAWQYKKSYAGVLQAVV